PPLGPERSARRAGKPFRGASGGDCAGRSRRRPAGPRARASPPAPGRARAPPRRVSGPSALLPDEEVRPSVLRPAALRALAAQRPLRAVAQQGDAGAVDSQRDQVVPGGRRPALAERDVVLVGAALVGVALDQQERAGIGPEPARVVLEECPILAPDRVAVELEVDVTERGDLAE